MFDTSVTSTRNCVASEEVDCTNLVTTVPAIAITTSMLELCTTMIAAKDNRCFQAQCLTQVVGLQENKIEVRAHVVTGGGGGGG